MRFGLTKVASASLRSPFILVRVFPDQVDNTQMLLTTAFLAPAIVDDELAVISSIMTQYLSCCHLGELYVLAAISLKTFITVVKVGRRQINAI
jgi:hypothetical protein